METTLNDCELFDLKLLCKDEYKREMDIAWKAFYIDDEEQATIHSDIADGWKKLADKLEQIMNEREEEK